MTLKLDKEYNSNINNLTIEHIDLFRENLQLVFQDSSKLQKHEQLKEYFDFLVCALFDIESSELHKQLKEKTENNFAYTLAYNKIIQKTIKYLDEEMKKDTGDFLV